MNVVPFGGLGEGINAPNTAFGFAEFTVPGTAFTTSPLSPLITQDIVNNPNSLLQSHVEHLDVVSTVKPSVATATGNIADSTSSGANGLAAREDIPFVVLNASVNLVTATFWIETVRHAHPFQDRHFLQLQYSQTVLLNFLGFFWPRCVSRYAKKGHVAARERARGKALAACIREWREERRTRPGMTQQGLAVQIGRATRHHQEH